MNSRCSEIAILLHDQFNGIAVVLISIEAKSEITVCFTICCLWAEQITCAIPLLSRCIPDFIGADRDFYFEHSPRADEVAAKLSVVDCIHHFNKIVIAAA